jgi:hypothetical protein
MQPLKIQYGDIYIQIPTETDSLESIDLAIATLCFMEERLEKQKQPIVQEKTEVKKDDSC